MTTPTFSLSATTDCQIRSGQTEASRYAPETATQIRMVRAQAIVATQDDAREFVATLPKAWRVKASYIVGSSLGTGYIYFDANFSADKANKGANEAGMKRLRAFLARVSYTYSASYLNSATPEQFAKFLETGSIL